MPQSKEAQKRWRDRNKEHLRKTQAEWRDRNREYHNARAAYYHRTSMYKAREELSDLLGGKCFDCGNSDVRTFQFHHAKGGGNKLRKDHSYTASYYRSLILEVLKDPSSIVLLCANCHAIRHWNETNLTPLPPKSTTEEHYKTIRKLTAEQVVAIRKKREEGALYSEIAKEYGISNQSVESIINRRSYKWVE